jgi:uncharacterized protein YgbK (DUF1537 family)
MKRTQIIVFDDDPTGIQTVHGCLLVTEWDQATIRQAFADDAAFFFILTNTRAYRRGRAEQIIREAIANVLAVNRQFGYSLILISRSDSTLRSHFPAEINALAAAVEAESGKEVDGIFVAPAFLEGGRKTVGDVHYLAEKQRQVPVSETEYAHDPVFPYRSSHLPTYIEEKTGGRVRAADVRSIPVEWLREPGGKKLASFLPTIRGRRHIVVNAESYEDLRAFSFAILESVRGGMVVLFQSAASLVKCLAGLDDPPMQREHVGGERTGVIVAGSYVQKTTIQLTQLLQQRFTMGIEIDPALALVGDDALRRHCLARLREALDERRIPVLYTTRRPMPFASPEKCLDAGERIGMYLASLVRGMPSTLGFFIAKGGVTSALILRHGFQVRAARVIGVLSACVPMISLPPGAGADAGMPYVIFPGNVGDENALVNAVTLLSGKRGAP